MLVLDCSIAIAFLLRDETPADDILDSVGRTGALAPSLLAPEVSNVLLTAERRGRISAADADRALALLLALPIRLRDAPAATVLALGRRHGLTSYDAAYLALALDAGTPLATRDAALAEAARREGLERLTA
jgi:predicted nucleic acid-binding protein